MKFPALFLLLCSTQNVASLSSKEDASPSRSFVGQAILDRSTMKRASFYGNGVSTNVNAQDTFAQVTGAHCKPSRFANQEAPASLSNAACSDPTLLNGTTLKRLVSTSPISLSVDSDAIASASDAPLLADITSAISSAGPNLISASSVGEHFPYGVTNRRLNTAKYKEAVAMSESSRSSD